MAKRHTADDAVGYKLLLELLAEHGDTEENPIPVTIETSRGLLVAVLRTGKRKVHAINPLAAARYRHSVSRKKSDPGDALVLANILRTDMHAHRPLPFLPVLVDQAEQPVIHDYIQLSMRCQSSDTPTPRTAATCRVRAGYAPCGRPDQPAP